jgi:hypothetical protein
MVGQTLLKGRDSEFASLDGLLDAVRGGESRTLVLRGEPGVGKTALLDYTVSAAPDFRVLRAVGVESEMEFAFASLQQLCSRARSMALLSDRKVAEARYREAVERLGRSRVAVHLGRAQLVYGEWLRRENRRVDARQQLRAAHDTFSRVPPSRLSPA